MKQFHISAVLMAFLVLGHSGAYSQSMKPGLWEFQSTMKSKSGEMEAAMAEMQKQMAAMPPEQRRQMEQMLSAQGVQLGAGKGGAHVVRVCISPEEAARFHVQDDPGCKQDIVQRSASTVKIRFSCGGEIPSQGEGTISLRGDTGFNAQFSIQTRADGKTDRMDMTQQGRWLGASCGGLKP